VLNHASTSSARGLDYASDVDSILRNLQSAAHRMPQLLHSWLTGFNRCTRRAGCQTTAAATPGRCSPTRSAT